MTPPVPPELAATAGDGFAQTASRPASLWPESTAARPGDAQSTGFPTTRFDPLAEEKARLDAQARAAFDVCHPALALRAVLLVQAVLALAALAGASSVSEWGARQAVFAFGGAAATLAWLVAVCALKRPLARRTPALRALPVLALGAMAALGAWAPLAWAGFADAGPRVMRVAAVALTGAAFAALLWGWLELRSRLWQPAAASARLAELQSRIRPHFLFNALNTALALVRVDPGRAETVLEDLAQLFRVALADVGAAVTLEEEIDLARRYLEIEQVRFGSRLAVQWQVDPRVNVARVPPLVLQPLVENAVRHGIEPAAGGGRLRVQARVQRGQAVVQVTNTVGAEPAAPGHGMALHNVRERLRLLHDVAAELDVWRESGSADGGQGDLFHARLVVPLD